MEYHADKREALAYVAGERFSPCKKTDDANKTSMLTFTIFKSRDSEDESIDFRIELKNCGLRIYRYKLRNN